MTYQASRCTQSFLGSDKTIDLDKIKDYKIKLDDETYKNFRESKKAGKSFKKKIGFIKRISCTKIVTKPNKYPLEYKTCKTYQTNKEIFFRKYIENQGNFSAHDLRVSPTNRDTLKLDAIWKKTLPLRRDILNPRMQQDIRNLLIPHEVIISFIEQEFWNTLKNKTGIDELLADLTMVRHSETGEIKIDMFDWAQSILTNQNSQKNYKRLDSLIKEAVNNLAVDCAEVIKNFCLEQINKLIDERQAILFLCT